jgi:5-methylcytosine-specific restriction endonuclease McrA
MKHLNDVLVLNKAWIPLHIAGWQEAMKHITIDNAHSLDREYNRYDFATWIVFSQHNAEDYKKIHTVKYAIAIPEIIVLNKFNQLPDRDIKFNRENIILRDKNRCQYCGEVFPTKQLQIEHIIPKSRGGKKIWNNLVASCHACNTYKANRTPEEAGMKLIRKPVKPNWINPISHLKGKTQICTSWKKWLANADDEII